MVVERERTDLERDSVHDGHALERIFEELVEDSVLGLRVGAQEVHEELYLNVFKVAALHPARVCSKDGHTISRGEA